MDAHPRPVKIARATAAGGRSQAGGTTSTLAVGPGDTSGSLGVIVATTVAGGGPPFHVHPAFDETFVILGGRFAFHTHDGVQEVGPGDTVFVPGEVPHAFRCVEAADGFEGGRTAMVVTPGRFIGFFDAMRDMATRDGGIDQDQLAELGLEWGVRFPEPPPNLS
ncbi:MAG: cupin domain-containing protein [Planctomycetota bacterium]